MKKKHGYLVISLDFELLWGVFDVMSLEENRSYFDNTRKVIPELLKIFEDNKIHATWATVGMLFNENWHQWKINIPKNLPQYENVKLSSFKFGEEHRNEDNSNLCFAPELIELISQVPGQEIGTHTYSHYYCQEPGQNIMSFNADLLKSRELAGKINISLKSLVFPRNQLQKEYLLICAENGIKNVRSNPGSWYWKNARSNAITTKLARTGDAYFPLGKKSYPIEVLKRIPGLPLEQPASRFLRPVESSKLLRSIKLRRILKEMEFAAKNNEIYHLWWHPHNFGNMPQESLKDLQQIINSFSKLRKAYNFQSANMFDIGEIVP